MNDRRNMLLGAALSAILIMNPVDATVASESNDFTFKRTKVPRASTRKRITIQIGVPDKPAPKPTPRQTPTYAWFWKEISPGFVTDPATRAQAALKLIEDHARRGRALYGNRSLISQIVAAHGREIREAATRTNISAAFLIAVIAVESRGNPTALSPAGAKGLMQLMPATATRMGVTDRSDPAQNVMGGARYLKGLLKLFSNDPLLTLAGYNAGENAVIRKNGVPPYKETRAYVPKVLSAWRHARAFCATVPATLLDPCQIGPAAPNSVPTPNAIAPDSTELSPFGTTAPAPSTPEPSAIPVTKSVPLDN